MGNGVLRRGRARARVDAVRPRWVVSARRRASGRPAVGRRRPETFAYRYREGESQYERFLVHKTIFPSDFLADFGFQTLRRFGHVELARLEFGGLVPVVEGKRELVMRVVKEAFTPAPAPVPPGP